MKSAISHHFRSAGDKIRSVKWRVCYTECPLYRKDLQDLVAVKRNAVRKIEIFTLSEVHIIESLQL